MLGAALGPDFNIIAEACNGMEALEVFRAVLPHVVILELALPNASGLSVLRHLRSLKRGRPAMLIFTGTRNEELIFASLDEHPQGFVLKEEAFDTLRGAIDIVCSGGTYFSPRATDYLDRWRSRAISGRYSLSEREQMILQLVAEGYSSKEVAGRLSLSPKTVENYRSQLMQKLDLRDISAITRYAVQRGLVDVN